jgi:hypothetical protein
MPKNTSEQLETYGQSLHYLLLELPEHDAVTDTLDYVMGALCGLSHANRIGFQNRPNKFVNVYRAYLANDALKVATDEPLNPLWTAGYSFNSGIQRIAAVFDRIPRLLGAKMKKMVRKKAVSTSAKERMAAVNAKPYGNWERVYDEINTFKHSPKGRAEGRTVTLNEAVLAFGEIMELLSDNKARIIQLYGP